MQDEYTFANADADASLTDAAGERGDWTRHEIATLFNLPLNELLVRAPRRA